MSGQTGLHGADLTGAKVEGACFLKAIYDESTRFPDGFDPKEHDMELEAERGVLI